MPYEDHPISRSRGLLALAKVELNGEAVAWILPLGTDRVVDEGVEYIHSVVLEGCRSEYEGEERGKEGQLLASSFGGLPERSPKPRCCVSGVLEVYVGWPQEVAVQNTGAPPSGLCFHCTPWIKNVGKQT